MTDGPHIRIDVEPAIVRWHPVVRIVLCVPHLVWTGLLQVASIAVSFVIAASVLASGRVPTRLAAFQVLSLRERVRCYGFFFLLRSSHPPFATAMSAEDPGDDPRVHVSVKLPETAHRTSVVRRPLTLLLHLIALGPLALFLDLLYPAWMVMGAVRGGWPPWFARLLLEVERWVAAVVLYVTYASNEPPEFGLTAYRRAGDPR